MFFSKYTLKKSEMQLFILFKLQWNIINSVARGCSRQPLCFSVAVSGQGWYVFLFNDSSDVPDPSVLCAGFSPRSPKQAEYPCFIITCRLSVRNIHHPSHRDIIRTNSVNERKEQTVLLKLRKSVLVIQICRMHDAPQVSTIAINARCAALRFSSALELLVEG